MRAARVRACVSTPVRAACRVCGACVRACVRARTYNNKFGCATVSDFVTGNNAGIRDRSTVFRMRTAVHWSQL